jgi:hypothetical protein
VGAIALERRLTRRCNGLLVGAGGVAKISAAVELNVMRLRLSVEAVLKSYLLVRGVQEYRACDQVHQESFSRHICRA